MTHTKTLISLALAAGLGLASAAQAGNVEWSVSVGMPVPVQVAVPTPVYAPAPSAPTLPNIEQAQAQQQARIQWGVQVNLITGREFHRLQQTQDYIEQQRQWAYADGWLTYDEHMNVMHLLNGSAQQIERTLANWQRVDTAYYPMPPVLTVWNAPRPVHWNNGRHNGHNAHNGHRPQAVAPAVVQVAVPVQPLHPVVPRGHRAPMAAPAHVSVQPVVTQPPAQAQPQGQHSRHRDGQIPEGRARY